MGTAPPEPGNTRCLLWPEGVSVFPTVCQPPEDEVHSHTLRSLQDKPRLGLVSHSLDLATTQSLSCPHLHMDTVPPEVFVS